MSALDIVCPISPRRVDEHAARIVGLLVCAGLVAGLFTRPAWVAAGLALDFAVRAFTPWPISVLGRTGNVLARLLKLKRSPINAGPKILAARVGFVLSTAVSALAFSGLSTAATATACVLIFFSALEGFFGICVACRIHSLILTAVTRARPTYTGDGEGI